MRCYLLHTKNPASPRQHWVCGFACAGHFWRLLLASVLAQSRRNAQQRGKGRICLVVAMCYSPTGMFRTG